MNHISHEQLTDYLHRALAPEDDAQVYTHLENCADCRSAYQDEAALTEALRAHALTEERDLPSGVVAAVWSAIEASQRRSTFGEILSAWLRPAILVPLAAVIVIALMVVPRFVPTGAPLTIDAAYYLQDHAAMGSTMPFADTNIVPASLGSDDESQTTAVAVMPSMATADVQP